MLCNRFNRKLKRQVIGDANSRKRQKILFIEEEERNQITSDTSMTAGAPFPSHNNMVDQASQVEFLENDSTLNCNIFCNNLIVLGDTCDAATQISSISTTKSKSTPSVMNKTADKNCGTDIEYASKYVSPDPIVGESNLKCNEEFHGFN